MLQLHLHLSLEIDVADTNVFNQAAARTPGPLPTPAYDINVDCLSTGYAATIWQMVEDELLTGAIVNGHRMVSSSELSAYVPAGCCLDDETSACFISPAARI